MQAPPLNDKSAARSNLANARWIALHFRTLPDPGDHPQVIVIAHRPSGPSSKQNSFRLGDDLTQRSGSERCGA